MEEPRSTAPPRKRKPAEGKEAALHPLERSRRNLEALKNEPDSGLAAIVRIVQQMGRHRRMRQTRRNRLSQAALRSNSEDSPPWQEVTTRHNHNSCPTGNGLCRPAGYDVGIRQHVNPHGFPPSPGPHPPGERRPTQQSPHRFDPAPGRASDSCLFESPYSSAPIPKRESSLRPAPAGSCTRRVRTESGRRC